MAMMADRVFAQRETGFIFSPDGASPVLDSVFVLAGQSNAETYGTTGTPTGYGSLDPNVKIWNLSTGKWETYSPGVNSNLFHIPPFVAANPTFWGPEASFAKAWLAANPGKTCYIIKGAAGGMPLAYNGDAYTFDPATADGGFDYLTRHINEAMGVLSGVPATFSPQFHGSGFTLSNGNLTAASASGAKSGRATNQLTTGKRFCSFTIDSKGDWVMIGLGGGATVFTNNGYVGAAAGANIGYWSNGQIWRGGGAIDAIAAYTTGDVIDMEANATAQTVRFRKNGGAWSTAYDTSTLTGSVFPFVTVETSTITANFGATAYTHAKPVDAEDFQEFADLSPSIRSLLWMQGESDANLDTLDHLYADNLVAFIAAARSEWIAASMKMVLGRISNSTVWPYRAAVRAAQAAFPGIDGNAAWFDTDDLARQGDDAHYTGAAVETLGGRFFTNL